MEPETPQSSPTGKLTDGEKEQVKLTATYFNGVAIGLALVGGVSLPATILLNSRGKVDDLLGLGVGLFSFALSPYIHLMAKRWLRRLDR